MLGYLNLHLSICMFYVCVPQLSEQSHINGVETITELSVSGKKRFISTLR